MSVLTIQNSPDATKELLIISLAQLSLSLAQYVINILQQACNEIADNEPKVMEAAAN